jgi:uncharacterized membrane protein YhiD involved in acid resistance
VFYGFFKILRIAVKFNAIVIAVQDFIFWFLSGLAVFMFALWQSDGIVRGYVLIGVVIGALLYYLTIGAMITHSAIAIVGFFQRILDKIRNGAKICADNTKKKAEVRRQQRSTEKTRRKQETAQANLKKNTEQGKKPKKTRKQHKKRKKTLEIESGGVV